MQKTQTQKEKELIRMSITPVMADSFITVAEKAIDEYRKELHELIEPFKKLEEPYLAAKAKIDMLETEIKKYELTLETISRARTGNNSPDFRVKRATSHTESKRSRGNVIKWNREFALILKTENRFMKYEELVAAFFKRFPNLKTAEAIDRKLYQQLGNMKEGEADAKRRREAGKKNNRKDSADFLRYKDEWGLIEWFGNDYVPLPQYMKQFMYQNAS